MAVFTVTVSYTYSCQKLDYLPCDSERRGVGHDHEWDEIEVPVVRPCATIVYIYITAPPECAVQRVLNARQDLRCYAAAAC